MTAEERKAYQKEYYNEHRDQYKIYYKFYYQANKERLIRQNRELVARYRSMYAADQAWIRPAREAKGISLREMSRRLGVTPCAVRRYEIGELKAPQEKIKEVLGIT